ncbi:uncharacterized protein LOC121645428 [Melanotaenia boesemani]|uniref:uncharacterized protein LOC121645428 n=1 Tax=Melanotaenia boesemani TaxID=1250792 RepID=UPI001C04F3F0|nr:uncharacterized protein LOC121645428 [Melanotaenia boesemani]XP_041849822.1 uncharacterized protein LOC121645428 [Melanotaenia boesemani]
MGFNCSKPQRKERFEHPEVSPFMRARTVTRPVADKQTETEGGVTKETQTEEGNLWMESRAVIRFDMQTKPLQVLDTPWTPTELYNWLKEAPDPFTKPIYFHKHLHLFCMAYEPRPAQVRSLLELAYNSKWEKVEKDFCVPGADTDADWLDADAMATWLKTVCLASVSTTAMSDPGFFARIYCNQEPKESVTHFISRFQEMKDSAWGEAYATFATSFLMNSLQSHVAELFKLKVICWESLSLVQAISTLKAMDSKGMFESKRKTLGLINDHWAALEDFSIEELPAPTFNSRPRRAKRRGRCYHCGKFGHWIRECRAVTQQQPHPALGWQYLD